VTAAMAAKNGMYFSGGRLKDDNGTIFGAIDGVVAKTLALRKELATKNLELADAVNIAPLRSEIDKFIRGGVSHMDSPLYERLHALLVSHHIISRWSSRR
jgi:hypothetical protein